MNEHDFIATAQIKIDASLDIVWDALINPDVIKQYMFDAKVISDWRVGSKITWEGEWKGKTFKDKGKILEVKPKKRLAYSHYSPLTGEPDIPENYHTVSLELENVRNQTTVMLTQDNNSSEEAKKHSESNWLAMLSGMKKILEEK